MTNGSLKVKVVNLKEKPLARATVIIGEKTYQADEKGQCVIPSLPQGSFTVQAAAEGFDIGSAEAFVIDGQQSSCIVKVINRPEHPPEKAPEKAG